LQAFQQAFNRPIPDFTPVFNRLSTGLEKVFDENLNGRGALYTLKNRQIIDRSGLRTQFGQILS
jgi:hypothetical protein